MASTAVLAVYARLCRRIWNVNWYSLHSPLGRPPEAVPGRSGSTRARSQDRACAANGLETRSSRASSVGWTLASIRWPPNVEPSRLPSTQMHMKVRAVPPRASRHPLSGRSFRLVRCRMWATGNTPKRRAIAKAASVRILAASCLPRSGVGFRLHARAFAGFGSGALSTDILFFRERSARGPRGRIVLGASFPLPRRYSFQHRFHAWSTS